MKKDYDLKIVRISVLLYFLISFGLNMIWVNDGFKWAYWVSRFLLGVGLIIIGLTFIAFPKTMMLLLITNKSDYDSILGWKIKLSGFIAGLPILMFGAYFLFFVLRAWKIECIEIANCLF